MGQSGVEGLVPTAVAVHVSVVPDSTPLAVPAICRLAKQVAVNDPLTVLPVMSVTVQWKFVHVFCSVVVDDTDAHVPLSAWTPVVLGVVDELFCVSRSVQPTLVRAAASVAASNLRIISGRSLDKYRPEHTATPASQYNLRMAILKVARMGHPVLRAKARPIPPANIGSPGVQQLIDDMFETMREYAGIGLAAPQVHHSLRIFVAGVSNLPVPPVLESDEDMPFIALVNPEITPVTRKSEEGWEGCLSIPDIRGLVPRPLDIQVKAYDRHGKRIELVARGLSARVIQHETDHLDGILFFDRMTSYESLTFMEEYRRFWAKDEDEESADEATEKAQDKR